MSKPATSSGKLPQTFREELSSLIHHSNSSIPLHHQLTTSLRGLILSREWEDPRLPAEGELASLLNVSVSTVRQALAPLISEQLIARQRAKGSFIKDRETQQELKYLTIIKPDFSSSSMDIPIEMLRRRAARTNTEVRVIELKKGEGWQELDRRIGYKPNEGGVLLLQIGLISTVNLYHLLTEKGYRTVNFGDYQPDYPGTLITTNYRSTIHLGLRTLRDLGHKRVVFFVSEPEENNEIVVRCRLFEEEAAELGISEASIYHCGTHNWENSFEEAMTGMPYIWNSAQRPTAIFAVSDGTARGVYQWLVSNGHALPQDLSLLSFDGTDPEILEHEISSLVAPLDAFGAEIFRLLKSPSRVPRHLFFDPTLRFGRTIGSPS